MKPLLPVIYKLPIKIGMIWLLRRFLKRAFSRVYRPLSSPLIVYLSALFLVLSTPCFAWNGAGHRLIAYIAWDSLSPTARISASRLLTHHPDYKDWLQVPSGYSSLNQNVFVEASTWADDIRRDPRFQRSNDEPTTRLPGFPDMLSHSHWHYDDSQALHTSSDDPGLYGVLPVLFDMLRNPANPARQSYALVWLLHLVADAHQPLHNGIRDDRGGNEFAIILFDSTHNRSSSLHTFWDDLPGRSNLRGTLLIHTAETLMSMPIARRASRETKLDFRSWQLQNLETCRQFGYPKSSESPAVLSSQFVQMAQTISQQQLVLAGKRLALLIEAALNPQTKTPFYVERRPSPEIQ